MATDDQHRVSYLHCSKSLRRKYLFQLFDVKNYYKKIFSTNKEVLEVERRGCMYVWSSHIAKVRINLVRLPTLLVVS